MKLFNSSPIPRPARAEGGKIKKMKRPTGVFKTTNSYQQALSSEFYEKCPKAVLAAIAVSFVVNFQGTDLELAEEILLNEWKTLNENGIVPQKPFRDNKNAEDIY